MKIKTMLSHSDEPAENAIVYFTGWGTTPSVVEHLTRPDHTDLIACYDFTEIDQTALEPYLTGYKQIYVIGWSIGVWAAECLAHSFPEGTQGIALNGTPYPMDDAFGIPKEIFRGTLDGLNDENRKRFDRRMCGGRSLLRVYESFSARSTEDLRAELLAVYNQVKSIPHRKPLLDWTHAFISEKDLIIPPANQLNYWQTYDVPTEILPAVGHYPFIHFTSWYEIIR